MYKGKLNNKDSEESKNDLWRTLLYAGLSVFAIWLLSWVLIDLCISEFNDRGTFGDKFGAINALFSGLAFAGLIVTLLYQKDELKLQREELAQTREELKGQREEFEEQNKTMKRQRFENTFFNMLSLQQDIVSNLLLEYTKYSAGNNFFSDAKRLICNGRNTFKTLYLDALIIDSFNTDFEGIKSVLECSEINNKIFISNTTIFNHYFRHLYRIIKYTDSTDLIEDCERYDYACIVRSQLSDYELVLLFYNCLTANGREKFKPLIEKYSMFNNLRIELLANHKHKNEYAEKAYNRYAE